MSEIWEPMLNLRFIEREGKRILQQAWGIYPIGFFSKDHMYSRWEWRDVPLVVEEPSDDA